MAKKKLKRERWELVQAKCHAAAHDLSSDKKGNESDLGASAHPPDHQKVLRPRWAGYSQLYQGFN